MKKPIAIDLFCGAGGMSEGIIQAGFHIIYSNDKSHEAINTYKNRHEQIGLHNEINTVVECNDISLITGESIKQAISRLQDKSFHDCHIDAIFGGPPCQGFSRAGLRNKNDPRNFLFREYIRVISEIMPDYVVFENVVGLLDSKLDNYISHDGMEYQQHTLITKILENELCKLGYQIQNRSNDNKEINFKSLVVNSADFGVPQARERVIVIAYKKSISEPQNLENYKSKNQISVKEAIADLIIDNNLREAALNELKREGKFDFINSSRTGRILKHESSKYVNHDFSNHQPHIYQRFSLFKQGETSKQLRVRILSSGFSNLENISDLLNYSYKITQGKLTYANYKEYIKDINNITKIDTHKQNVILDAIISKKNQRVRLNPNQPSRTIVTLPDDYISPFEDRIFSVREMARLQSFDDNFEFLGKRTTGGDRRRDEVPQYTQVGNAVPPLLAKAIAMSIIDVIKC